MRLLACFCVFLVTISAQEVTRGSWARVEQLTSGNRVIVQDFNGREHKGRVSAVTSNSLGVETSRGTVNLERANVREVKARRISGRARNSAIGAAVGGGVGLGTAGILLAMTGGSDLTGPILLVFTFIGAAVGFGLGWIPPGNVTLYRAQR